MCVAVPCQISEIDGLTARARIGGTSLTVRLDLVESIEVGDYVLVHSGFALERLDEEDAKATIALLKKMDST